MKNELTENGYLCHVPDRIMDAPLLAFDLPVIIEKIKQEKAWKMGERNAITLLKSPCLRIVLVAIQGHTEINFHETGDLLHKSGSLLSVQLIEGNMDLVTKDRSLTLKKGSLATFHGNVKHVLIAHEESIFLLTVALCPVNTPVTGD